MISTGLTLIWLFPIWNSLLKASHFTLRNQAKGGHRARKEPHRGWSWDSRVYMYRGNKVLRLEWGWDGSRRKEGRCSYLFSVLNALFMITCATSFRISALGSGKGSFLNDWPRESNLKHVPLGSRLHPHTISFFLWDFNCFGNLWLSFFYTVYIEAVMASQEVS